MKNHYHFLHASLENKRSPKNNSFKPQNFVIQRILSFAGSYWIANPEQGNGQKIEQFLN